jgi:hypothetical protein
LARSRGQRRNRCGTASTAQQRSCPRRILARAFDFMSGNRPAQKRVRLGAVLPQLVIACGARCAGVRGTT